MARCSVPRVVCPTLSLLIALAIPQSLRAERRTIIPSGNAPIGRFSPELALVAYGKAVLVGQTSSGLTVFDVPGESELATHGMSTSLDRSFSVQAVGDDALDTDVQFVISHQGWSKPSRRAIRERGFDVVDEFARGRFIVVRPRRRPVQPEQLQSLGMISGINRLSVNYSFSVDPPAGTAPQAPENEANRPSNGVVNDPRFHEQWGLRDIQVVVPWRQGAMGNANGPEVVVAVVDTGVDHTHEDLRANMWINPGEIPGNHKDDDSNGIIDDVHGADFVDRDGDPTDTHGHGTHCAGIIGAVGNNGRGISGVNWKTRIMAIRCLGRKAGSNRATGHTTDIVKGIFYAIDQGVDVINCSFGSPAPSFEMEHALRQARAHDIIVVAAAGNTGQDIDTRPVFPAAYSDFRFDHRNVISVAAIDEQNRLADFSNHGNHGKHGVQLAAPGVSILSTVPDHSGTYAFMRGTSMAAPHVSGAVALMRSHPHLSLAKTWEQVREMLLDKAVRRVETLNGKCESGGTLDLSFIRQFQNRQPRSDEAAPLSASPVLVLPEDALPERETTVAVPLDADSPVSAPFNTLSNAASVAGASRAQPLSFSHSDYYYEPRVVTSSDNILSVAFELPARMDVVVRAEASATAVRDTRMISVGYSQSAAADAPLVRASQRLVTVRSSDNDHTLLTNNHAMSLDAGRHVISWRMDMVKGGSGVALRGGAGLYVRAFPIARSASFGTASVETGADRDDDLLLLDLLQP